MVTIAAVADWAGIGGDETVADTFRGALFGLLGCDGTMHPRNIGSIAEVQYHGYVGQLTIGTRQPNPVESAKVGLFGRVCRISVGVQLTQVEEVAAQQAVLPLALPSPWVRWGLQWPWKLE